MWNIILGILFIIGGFSGRFTLIGTNSPMLLVVIGVGMIIWGGVQIARRRPK